MIRPLATFDGAQGAALYEPHIPGLAHRLRLAVAVGAHRAVAGGGVDDVGPARAITLLRRIPAMNGNPAITLSIRPRAAATWSNSTPQSR